MGLCHIAGIVQVIGASLTCLCMYSMLIYEKTVKNIYHILLQLHLLLDNVSKLGSNTNLER